MGEAVGSAATAGLVLETVMRAYSMDVGCSGWPLPVTRRP